MRTTCPSCHEHTLGFPVLLRAWFRALGVCPSCGAHFIFSPWSAALVSIALFALFFFFIWVAGQLHSLLFGIALIILWVGIVGGVHAFVPVVVMPTLSVRRHRLIGLLLVILAVVWIVVSNSVAQNGIYP